MVTEYAGTQLAGPIALQNGIDVQGYLRNEGRRAYVASLRAEWRSHQQYALSDVRHVLSICIGNTTAAHPGLRITTLAYGVRMRGTALVADSPIHLGL